MPHDFSDKTMWRGVVVDYFTLAFIQDVEQDLGKDIEFVYQGSYSTGIIASSQTHWRGQALDIWEPSDPNELVRIMRRNGGAAWNRAGKGDWVAHIHVIVGGAQLWSSEAEEQWHDYVNGGDGLWPLTGNDDYHWRPDNIRGFDYAQSKMGPFQHGPVRVHQLKRGVRDSDSVRRLQRRLKDHPKIPARDVKINGHYDEGTESAVQFWQREIYDAENPAFRNGEEVNNKQANQFFGDRYRVIEE